MSVACEGVSLQYDTAGHPALAPLQLQVGAGEQVAVIGPSGAGKTSLLQLLATARTPSSGRLTLLGETLPLAGTRLQALRRRIGWIQQAPPLPPRQRVVTAVLAGRLGQWPLGRSLRSLLLPVDPAGAAAALARLDLADRLYDRCGQLSGGQLQRVAIARALYQQPALLLADEPVSAMDPVLARHTLEVLCAEARSRQATLVASLHAVELALACFPRVIGLRDGQLAFDKPAPAVTEADLAALYANARLDPLPASPPPAPVTLYIPRC